MNFLPVILWSDVLVWLLVAGALALARASRANPLLRAAWRRVGGSAPAMAAATVLVAFVLVGLIDSLHYRPALATRAEGAEGAAGAQKTAYAVEVLSALDAIAMPLRTRVETTYSAPFALYSYAKATREQRDAAGELVVRRDFPRLIHGGAHLGDDTARRGADIALRTLRAWAAAGVVWALVATALAAWQARAGGQPYGVAWRVLWRGQGVVRWRAVLTTLGALLFAAAPLVALCVDYHVFGTDKVGQDVFYQILKSIRTALVIGLVTTLVTLPLAVFLGIAAGYFRGWVDDAIQYAYTTLSSIPGVLLIAGAVLMMQMVIDAHPDWFATAAERADLRLLALCFILGLTSWTGLARLLRGETLKLRELEYIQAAQAFGVGDLRLIARHILPNLMHIVIIALVMDFSGLVLAEAVLSYVGIGVDPAMTSFGTLINNARTELTREPVVWWSLTAAFVFMFALVLAANLFADALRDAFDPRLAGRS